MLYPFQRNGCLANHFTRKHLLRQAESLPIKDNAVAKSTTSKELRLRNPCQRDAAAIWQLVGDSGVLDQNSSYLYLLMCRDFSGTCLVAERNSQVVGFVTGYRPPSRPNVLFVWQIAVSRSAQGQGLGLRLLVELLRGQNDEIKFVEATIAPSNQISRRLFRSLSETLEADFVESAGFDESDFPGEHHESEPVIRIGPLLPSSTADGNWDP